MNLAVFGVSMQPTGSGFLCGIAVLVRGGPRRAGQFHPLTRLGLDKDHL